MGKSTISMAMFNSFLFLYQAGYYMWRFVAGTGFPKRGFNHGHGHNIGIEPATVDRMLPLDEVTRSRLDR
jgi:hypothetical protein